MVGCVGTTDVSTGVGNDKEVGGASALIGVDGMGFVESVSVNGSVTDYAHRVSSLGRVALCSLTRNSVDMTRSLKIGQGQMPPARDCFRVHSTPQQGRRRRREDQLCNP